MSDGLLHDYEVGPFFDEVFEPDGTPRPHYRALVGRISEFEGEELARRGRVRDAAFRSQGITFTVYGEGDDPERGLERTFPLDLIPRIIPAEEWRIVEAGLIQRVTALNRFLEDLYAGEGAALHDGIVPRDVVLSADGFERMAFGVPVPHGARCVVAGIDLVRDRDGRYLVLEDNLRNPSGISYVLENRVAMTRVLPLLFASHDVRPVNQYGTLLHDALSHIAPPAAGEPTAVVLTPGIYNSAYFEHVFLARQMGVELVEGRDLVVDDHVVYMRTTRGLQRVDVIYRRIDDPFLDPVSFRPDSLVGVPGLLAAMRAGNVTVANALGNGVADDKAVYAYVPALIEYYLNAEPILASVPTYLPTDPKHLEVVLDRLDELVVKPVAGSGGYGLLIGPDASAAEIEAFRAQVQADPRGYIAQEVVSLSRHPTVIGEQCGGRHIDLRPFVVVGEKPTVLPGGLTRVALREGSLVVNSSQGGGSKDTWVLGDGSASEGDEAGAGVGAGADAVLDAGNG